jgi:fermentation-respiration switch protein FrsA (DUF1100 family)
VGVVLYAAAIARLMSQETELIFRTAAARADTYPAFPYQQIELPRQDRARQIAWIMAREKADGKTDEDLWILYLHGNASTIASRMSVAHYRGLHELGVNLLAPEYRGYNGLAGIPSEASVGADARAGYDYLRTEKHVPAARLVIYGWSLGAAVAVDLASQVDARAVILEGAPASIVDIGQQRYPYFPIRLIIRNPFQAIEKVARIRAPLLFLHSPEDVVVPFTEGRRLFEAAPSPKTFVEVRGGHINSSEVDHDVFYSAVKKALTPPAPLQTTGIQP